MLNRRITAPRGVIRDTSRSDSAPAATAPDIVRNLIRRKGRPPSPARVCAKKIGRPMEHQIAQATIAHTGSRMINATVATTKSTILFITERRTAATF